MKFYNGIKLLSFFMLCAHAGAAQPGNPASGHASVAALNNQAEYLLKQDELPAALSTATEAIQLAEKNGDQLGLANTCLLAGKICTAANDPHAMDYLKQAATIFENNGKLKDCAAAWDALGLYYWSQQDSAHSAAAFKQALDLEQMQNDWSGMAQTFNHFATAYQHQSYYETSAAYFRNALHYAEQIGDSSQMAEACLGLFTSYDKRGDLKNATIFVLKAKSFCQSDRDTELIASMNYSFGVLNMQLGNYEEALRYHLLALEDRRKIHKQNMIATSENQIGSVYTFLGEYATADEYLQSALRILQQEHYPKVLASCHDNLGINYEKMNDWNAALHHYQLALQGFRSAKEKFHTSKSLCNIGNILIKQQQYQQAEDTFLKGLALAKAVGAKESISRAFMGLSTVFEMLQKTDSAYYYLSLYNRAHDSLLSEASSKQLVAMQVLYESEKKDHDIAKLKLENENKLQQIRLFEASQEVAMLNLKAEQQQSVLIASENERNKQNLLMANRFGRQQKDSIRQLALESEIAAGALKSERSKKQLSIIAAIGFIGLITLLFYQFYRRRQARNNLELTKLNNKVLRAQLNPHFIFNALSSISNYVQQQPNLGSHYLTKFSALMRQVLENSESEKITLREELDMLENYMQLESIRLPYGFKYSIIYQQGLDAEEIMVPPLILQPMVENAIWHGLKPLDRMGKINLSFRESDGLLEVTIEDDGVGIGRTTLLSAAGIQKKRSMGMKIMRERINLVNRKSKVKGWLTQKLLEQGTRVEIAIPI